MKKWWKYEYTEGDGLVVLLIIYCWLIFPIIFIAKIWNIN